MRNLLAATAALATLAVASCSIVTADDFHQRGRTSAFLKDTADYRAMDNAIHDVLVESYGKGRVMMIEAPERKHHRWAATSDEDVRGGRHRVRVEARPMPDSDGRYSPSIQVKDEFYRQGNPFAVGAPGEFGGDPWIEGARDEKSEVKLANAVNARIRAWEAAGRPEPGNRRDEWFAAREKK